MPRTTSKEQVMSSLIESGAALKRPYLFAKQRVKNYFVYTNTIEF